MSIIGIYNIPEIKLTCFVIPAFQRISDCLRQLRESKKRMEYFAHILRLKDHKIPTTIQQWRCIIIEHHEFLQALESYKPTVQQSTSQSFHNPEQLELLSINLSKTPDNTLYSLNTSKELGFVPEEDIIEVFI